MEIRHYLRLPDTTGEIVDRYLQVLAVGTNYPAYTLNEDLTIEECLGRIEENDDYDYHRGLDCSKLELHVIKDLVKQQKWFSLNRSEVKKLQVEEISKFKKVLKAELRRLNRLNLDLE